MITIERKREILSDIVLELSEHGLEMYDYRLHDVIDVDALEALLSSTSSAVEVQFSVCGITITANSDGISSSQVS